MWQTYNVDTFVVTIYTDFTKGAVLIIGKLWNHFLVYVQYVYNKLITNVLHYLIVCTRYARRCTISENLKRIRDCITCSIIWQIPIRVNDLVWFLFSGDGSRFTRRGTYKVKRGKSEDNKENNGDQMNVPSIRISKPGEGKAHTTKGDIHLAACH